MTVTTTDLMALCRKIGTTGQNTYPPGCELCRDNTYSSTRGNGESDSRNPKITVVITVTCLPHTNHNPNTNPVSYPSMSYLLLHNLFSYPSLSLLCHIFYYMPCSRLTTPTGSNVTNLATIRTNQCTERAV